MQIKFYNKISKFIFVNKYCKALYKCKHIIEKLKSNVLFNLLYKLYFLFVGNLFLEIKKNIKNK
jgi:hypothetical protein